MKFLTPTIYRVSQKNALSESSLRSYNPSKPTSLACRLQAASGDLSDVSACRMMILKVRFFWDTLYNLIIITIIQDEEEEEIRPVLQEAWAPLQQMVIT